MREVHVVTCFLLRRAGQADEILVLRRSDRVRTYRDRWAAVSGYLEQAPPLEQAQREIEEETGLRTEVVALVAQGKPLRVLDEGLDIEWIVHPFLFEVSGEEAVRLDWEHREARWISPQEIDNLETVPGLTEALAMVYPPP